MKVLAKLGLVTAAAATVLFIFIYEFQGPVLNRVMAEPPSQLIDQETVEEENKETTFEVVSAADETAAAIETEEEPENISETVIETSKEETVEIEDEPLAIEEIPVETVEEPVEIVEQPVVEKKFDSNQSRRIYGKITLSTSGEQLEGVNIMVPGSNVAKVSNATGGYTIQVPKNARELVFIYRGKKLVQQITSDNNLVNVRLNLETMQYD